MILTSMPLHLLAAKVDHSNLLNNKSEIINSELPVNIAKPEAGQSAEGLIKNPDQKAIYTLRHDYKTQKGEKYEISYQPYIASVGEAATPDQQAKVNKEITLPNLAGYKKPIEDSFTIDYDTVKDEANGKNKTGNVENGFRFKAKEDHKYKAKESTITIKHIFQSMKDFSKYTNPDGTITRSKNDTTEVEYPDGTIEQEKDGAKRHERHSEQNGNTGSAMEASPLEEKDRRGFVPESEHITLQVPEDATDFVLEYRYNRAYYAVDFDTAGGTPLPSRTYYYDQQIPKIEAAHMPKKEGSDFLGWKPSHDLKDEDGNNYPEGQIIKKTDGKPALDLDVNLKMPALNIGKSENTRERLKFTAVWKDKDKADYAVQYWAEKADHADNASLLDKYDYMGTKVYKNKDTGMRPDLDNQTIKDIPFPDLDKGRLKKIWNGAKFNRDSHLLLNKFFVYNKNLTHEQNKDPKQPTMVKSVSSTGKTVYNIYYDRQVYDLYFTKSNYLKDGTEQNIREQTTFFPEVWGLDKNNKQVKLSGPGNPYHFKARFNQLMLDWPNDGMQIKGFTGYNNSHGWSPNTVEKWWDYRDTPPYRLSADQFLDFPEYENKGGYAKKIDKGDGTYINLDPNDFTTLSFGIEQYYDSIPHHMDFWMDGFKPGETIIRYDLYRSKADTESLTYGHKYTVVQGFTPYGFTGTDFNQYPTKRTELINEDELAEKNDERNEITPFPDRKIRDIYGFKYPLGEMQFIRAFFNTADGFGDDKNGKSFEKNGYLKFEYTRNKYPLRFNYDPQKTKGDNEFDKTNSLDTFYEFPLKALSPDLEGNEEYKKDNPKNLLDNPENLKKLGLTDLVFNDPNDDNKLKVKRPENLSDQMVFKGWALDPAGSKLVWENPKEKMPNHAINLYAKWGEPDSKWKVTFDPNGGKLRNIKEEKLTTERKTIQEGDIGQEKQNTYAKKEANDGDKQVFTVIQRQKLVKPVDPVRKGYDFMGWEVIRYKKDDKGEYTKEVDDSYRVKYGVPELYTFGNDVVSPITLKAIWNPNEKVDVKVFHHFLDKNGNKNGEALEEELEDKRTGYYTATVGDQQGEKWILATHEELMNSKDPEIKKIYEEYDKNFGFKNTYFQNQRIEPKKIIDTENSTKNKTVYKDNPNYKGNEFHFFYRPFRKREYKVNFIDERYKGKQNEKEGAIIDQEMVSNGNRHFDARNYRPIPGWKLVSDPQQQLFFDVDEDTNELKGINGTGSDEITFYYKDVRVIEVPKDQPVPEGYVRVTFKADKGGSFTDKAGNSVTELHYDVIKGLKSDLLPVPQELKDGETKTDNKQYITPETGKKFVKWDEKPLLNKNTIVDNEEKDYYEFTAKFEWSGLSASGLVRTEAFKDPNGKWTNDFAPTIEDLKKQLVWKEKDKKTDLPAETKLQFFDEAGNELKSDEDVFNLVNEKKKADTEELVRTVNIKVKATFKDGKETQELDIPITVYKNVYEALTGTKKPLFLSQAEKGELKDVTGEYVKVTVAPTGDMKSKDNKVYYVNPKAWVEIPKVDTTDNPNFTNWTANKKAQNEKNEENGVYDFTKRHKFTEDTVISPKFAEDVVEQKEGEDKPNVPDSYVKVIVDKTQLANLGTDEPQKLTFWVNPTRDVAITVANPNGKTDQEVDIPNIGKKKVNYVFKEWQKVKTGEADDKLTEVKPAVKIDLAKNKYTDKVTVIEALYKKSIAPGKIEEPLKTKKLDTPQGKEITNDDLIKQITPQEGKEIESIEVISKPDPSNPDKTEAKVIVKYKDGTTQGTKDNPVVIPVEVHKNIIPEAPGGQRPKDAMDNYVKVIFKAGTGGTVSGDLVYYVSPEVEVDMTESAKAIKKTPEVGYFVNGEKWTNKDNKTLKGTFANPETEFVFNFDKSKDIVEKTDDNVKKPDGYVTVTFKTEDEAKGKLDGNVKEKIYFVNPTAGIKLGKTATADNKTLVIPTPKANANYEFDKWQEAIDETNPITNDRTHVAIFKSGQVTLTYDKGGNNVTGDVPKAVTVNHGTSVVLAGKGTLEKPNAEFVGWKLDNEDKIYQPGDSVKLEKARTATAQWKSSTHKVTFDTKGGSNVPSQEVVHGKTATKPEAPKLDGKVFMGWKEKESDTTYFDFTKPITQEKTLIAIWQDPVQKIGENDTVEEQFIKVTFLKGKHGTLKDGEKENLEKVTYKVAKGLSFDQAKGLKVPEIDPAKYYKAKSENDGWDKKLDLTLAAGETEKIFTAQYKPQADVIPVDPKVTEEEQIQKEKPEGMVLVTFKVDEKKAYMLGDTRFYVKKDEVVNIETPLVRRLELGDGKRNDYVFKGWDLTTIGNKWKFSDDTTIGDGTQVNPTITIIIPSAGDPEVSVESMTEGATAYIEVTRSNKTTKIEAIYDEDYGMYFFEIPNNLGGELKKRDRIKVYAELKGIRSDTREYRVK